MISLEAGALIGPLFIDAIIDRHCSVSILIPLAIKSLIVPPLLTQLLSDVAQH